MCSIFLYNIVMDEENKSKKNSKDDWNKIALMLGMFLLLATILIVLNTFIPKLLK